MADISDKTANVSITNNAETKTVTVTTDGAKERLDVNTEGTVSLVAVTPKFDYSVAGTALNNSTYVTLKEITSTVGKLAFITVIGTNSTWDIRLSVDGVIILTIAMADLGSILNLSSSNVTTVPIFTTVANKSFIYNPSEHVDFTTGFKVEAIKTGGPATSVDWFIAWREEA